MSDTKEISQKELIESLRVLKLSDSEIEKSLDVDLSNSTEDEKNNDEVEIEKSIEEQIAEKTEELKELEELKKSNESENFNVESQFDNLNKSINDNVKSFEDRFTSIEELIKSLADEVKEVKDENSLLSEKNKELEKSLNSTSDELNKSIANNNSLLTAIQSYSPRLKSLSGKGTYVDRFEKSEAAGGENLTKLSITKDKDKISKLLSDGQDTSDLLKSMGEDIGSFEASTRVSDKLRKACLDELKIKLID